MALTAVARGVQHEDPHGAWRAYQKAQQADPDYLDAYVFAGEHCLDKYAWGALRRSSSEPSSSARRVILRPAPASHP